MGHGSSFPCLGYDCLEGMGYVPVAARRLRSQGHEVRVTNLGIPGAVISRRFQDLSSRYGNATVANFIDQEVPFVPRNATLVSIFAGPNDVNVITSALGAGAGGSDPVGYIDQQVRAFQDDYAKLLGDLRNQAASARVVVLNVPNLGAMPYLARASLPQRQAAQRAAVRMTTTVVNPLVSQDIRVVDVMCEQRLYAAANLSSDGFHPNDAGYALLADELVRAITSSSYPAPRTSCPQMSVVP
jgi:lysophospholipase L1-like esterase